MEFLLETFNEAQQSALGARDGQGGGEGSLPLMSELWHHGSYARLEKLLSQMKSERSSQYIHVRMRYLDAQDTVIEARVIRRSIKGAEVRLPPHTVARGQPAIKAGHGTARVAVRRWSPKVRLEKVRRGVDWLTVEMNGNAFLPREILEVVAA